MDLVSSTGILKLLNLDFRLLVQPAVLGGSVHKVGRLVDDLSNLVNVALVLSTFSAIGAIMLKLLA